MAIRDLERGALLHKLIEPDSPTSQLHKHRKELRKLRKRSEQVRRPGTGAEGGSGGSEGSGNPVVPKPDGGGFDATIVSTFALDGAYKPLLKVELPTAYGEMVRGLLGFQVRVRVMPTTTEADGAPQAQVHSALNYPNEGWNVTYIPLLSPRTDDRVEVEVQLLSDMFGAGGWSEPAVLGAYVDTDAPAAPSGVTATALPNSYLIDWTPPSEPDYASSRIYVGRPTSGPTAEEWVLVAEPKRPPALVVWDEKSYAVDETYNSFRVVHLDTSGNESVPAVVSIPTRKPIDTYDLQLKTSATVPIEIWEEGTPPQLRGTIYASPGGQYLVINSTVGTDLADYGLWLATTLGDVFRMLPGGGFQLVTGYDGFISVDGDLDIDVLGELRVNGDPLVAEGPSWPSAAAWTGRRFHNTTLGRSGVSDGTNWLSDEECLGVAQYRGTQAFTATEEVLATSLRSDYATRLTRFTISYYTGGGVDGSNYWRVYLRRLTSGISVDQCGYIQTTSNNWHKPADLTSFTITTLNASDIWLQVWAEKTGTVNALNLQVQLWGQLVLA